MHAPNAASATSDPLEPEDPAGSGSAAGPVPYGRGVRGRGPAVVRRAVAALPLLVVLVFTGLQVVAHPGWWLQNDSYRYARQSLSLLGAPRAEAQREATRAYCAAEADRLERVRGPDPAGGRVPVGRAADLRLCLRANAGGVSPTDPRYERIFDTRPGYPLLAAPAIGLLGIPRGMWLTGLVITGGGSLLVVALLRRAGASPLAAVAGQVLFLRCRLGWWSMQPLSEGALTAGVLAALLGSWWLLHGRVRGGAALLIAALGATALVKYSSALLLAGCLAAAAGCLALLPAGKRRVTVRSAALLGGIGATAAVVIAVSMRVLRLPSASHTLQEAFTHHFHHPPVADPWWRLLRYNVSFWTQWASDQAAQPLFLVLLAIGCWALLRFSPVLGVLALAAGAVGLATAAAHPFTNQMDRLWALAWVPAVLGVPLAIDLLRARR